MVRAIDIQHVLVQSNSMERIQQTQQQNPDQQQRYLNIQQKEEKKLSKETVKDTEELNQGRVQEKNEQEGAKRHASDQGKKKDEPGRGKDHSDDEHGEIIDILV